jgi:glucose-6-phosphate dehydrogenase assembly protein OpcA
MSEPSALDRIGTPVPLHQIEKEISQQLRAAQGDRVDRPVQRVRMSNLVVFCDNPDSAARVSSELPDIVATHPARVLLLVGERDQPPTGLTAAVLVQCKPLGHNQHACNEQVVIRARGHEVQQLPFVVRSNLIGDLPTNLWWATTTPPPLAGELLMELSENAQQIIYDSDGWTDPPRGVIATAVWLEGMEREGGRRWRVASDLNWRELKYWRRIVSEALADASAPGAANSISRVTVEHGPHAVVQGYLLIAWLSQRLGWALKSGKLAGKTETVWRFQARHGEVVVNVQRLPEGETQIHRFRIACTMDGRPVTMKLQTERGGRLSITLEGTNTAPRTLAMPLISAADLIGRQLSDREKDPVFNQSMSIAQQLARRLLA